MPLQNITQELEKLNPEEQAAQMYPGSDMTYDAHAVREAFVAGYREAFVAGYQAAKSDAGWALEFERSHPQDDGWDGWL